MFWPHKSPEAARKGPIALYHLYGQHIRERWEGPKVGWIRFVRQKLAISQVQWARRMDISRQAFHALEQREVQGTLTLGALRSAAEAMDLEVLIFVAPKQGSYLEYIHRQIRTHHDLNHPNQPISIQELERMSANPIRRIWDTDQFNQNLWNTREKRMEQHYIRTHLRDELEME